MHWATAHLCYFDTLYELGLYKLKICKEGIHLLLQTFLMQNSSKIGKVVLEFCSMGITLTR